MKKKSIITIGVILAVAAAAAILVMDKATSGKPVKKTMPKVLGAMRPTPAPAKKAIPKDKGLVTVRIVDSKKKEMYFRIRAFRSIDSRSSIYESSFVANKAQELEPGNYDIEIDSIPQKLYKNIAVTRGREKVEDLGSITGSINIKALDARRKDARYSINMHYPKSNIIVMAGTTNKSLEILPGTYDIEVATSPRQWNRNVLVSAGKETVIDLGCTTGVLIVKTADAEKKDTRYMVRIMKSENNEQAAFTVSNKPIEIVQGTYNVEVQSAPAQVHKDIKVASGEETVTEFLTDAQKAVQAPPSKTKR